MPTGIDHGTVTAVSDGHPFEITTLRRDVSTDGRRATVAFTDDWKEDAARRDFTINALSADPATGELFDYFGGLDDLEKRHIRFIGDPFQRIAEDHLRSCASSASMRASMPGEPDAAALEACTARANDLMALSRERIADELLKLLALPDPARTDQDHASERHPEAGASRRSRPKRLTDLEALIAAEVAADIVPDALRRLAALLPRDPAIAEDDRGPASAFEQGQQTARLRRGPGPRRDPKTLAYRIGVECAVDRLLLPSKAQPPPLQLHLGIRRGCRSVGAR